MTTKNSLSWQYDEFKQVGTDYSYKAELYIYDSRHTDFRHRVSTSINILDSLEITGSDLVIDFGAGTGNFVIQAARRCARVYSVDVSQAILDIVQSKTTQAELSNVEFHHAGFLNYEHADQPVDAIVTTFSLHHLPDFWKGIAFKRMNRMLKPFGKLYIQDVIIEEDNALKNIQALIDKLKNSGGNPLREDTERHFQDEYSTYDWLMDGLLCRAGFSIKSKHIDDGVFGTYICIKEKKVPKAILP
ncbi:MAG: class I SAM-dependent methyltransferase [Thermodesulfobacteriota bacterium]|nr:class I SAM-dependent methyltransferase [Thermodesulfobacteriota bacterium]